MNRRRKRRMDELTEQTARTVGARLRALRKAQRVTLVELARQTGVDIGTISRIETGRMTGTLESHFKMAGALGVKITDLYSGIEEARVKDAVTFTPASWRGDVYVHKAGRSSLTLLTSDVLKKKLMPMLITVEPGGSTQQEEAKVGTEKFLYVLDGSCEAHLGGRTHALAKGSSLYFDASIPHRFVNTGAHAAKCLCVVTPPVL
jgi:quercetin dioxygenase-like cupin family protein